MFAIGATPDTRFPPTVAYDGDSQRGANRIPKKQQQPANFRNQIAQLVNPPPAFCGQTLQIPRQRDRIAAFGAYGLATGIDPKVREIRATVAAATGENIRGHAASSLPKTSQKTQEGTLLINSVGIDVRRF